MIEVREGCVVEALLKGEVDVLLHVCNCQGVMGSGVAKVVREKVPEAFEEYEEAYRCYTETGKTMLGTISSGGGVYNLHAQEYYGYDGKRYLHYGALAESLDNVYWAIITEVFCGRGSKSEIIAIPYKMGSDRAGGDWDIVQELVESILDGYKVVAYKI